MLETTILRSDFKEEFNTVLLSVEILIGQKKLNAVYYLLSWST